jgi:hypothetical protein
MGFLTNPSLHRAETFTKVSKRKKDRKSKKVSFLKLFLDEDVKKSPQRPY